MCDLESYCTILNIKIMLKTRLKIVMYCNIAFLSRCLLVSKKGGVL